MDVISEGNKDGIIISYDEYGNYLWSKTLGGSEEDCCNEIIQTKDGGYIVVGYIASPVLYFNGEIIPQLSQSNYDVKNKDGFLLKMSQNGDYEWAVRIGGNLDDEIIKVIQTTNGDLAMIGNFYSHTIHFYENNTNYYKIESIQNKGEVNSFIASYSINGIYQWSQRIGGQDYIEICDITEIENNLAIVANYKGTIDIDTNQTVSSYLPDYADGIIISYSSKGEYRWYYELYSAPTSIYSDYKYIRLTAITTTKENNLVVAMACTNIVKGKKCGEAYKDIYTYKSGGINANLFMLSSQGDFIKNIYYLAGKSISSSATDASIAFNDVISTTNNDILVGGYYYSIKDLDVDHDGTTSGEFDLVRSSAYNSNGFFIKLDLEGKVNFSDCMYRKGQELFSISNINSVNEFNNQKIIAGGNFNWDTVTTKNFYQNASDTPYYLTRIGNVDGFILMENSKQDTLEPKKIVVNNFKKTYTITTEVKNHIETNQEGNEIEVKGGTITGIYNQTIDGISYTEEGVHFVEKVKHGESSSKEITITPDEGYKIEKILLNDEVYSAFTIDNNGKVTLPEFSNVTENIKVSVIFGKKMLHFYELPLTGANNILILDLIGGILIALGILKWKNLYK